MARGTLILILLPMALSGLAGCSPAKTTPPAAPVRVNAVAPGHASRFPLTLTDSRGKTLTLAAAPKRIVSLMPSNTEILFALGAGKLLVMDTTSCDYPPQAKSLPHVDALKPDIEPILAQRPDLVIADDKYNDRLIAALEKAGIPTLVVGIRTVDQTVEAVRIISSAVDAGKQGMGLAASMEQRLAKVRAFTAKATRKPKVLIMYGTNPIYTSGPDSFLSEVIGIAGGVNVIATPLPGDIVSAEKIVELQPDVIIASADLQRQAAKIPGWADSVPAVQNKQYFTLDDTLIRPGPRLPDAVAHLARYLHPEMTP
jgi:iron complex transport system substrate-binding protein